MQKLLNDELYVFDLTPFEITQQTEDAKVIYVQLECLDGYKELNASLADKMKGFNQFLSCVNDPWKNGVEPTPVTGHTVTGDISAPENTLRITDELGSDAGAQNYTYNQQGLEPIENVEAGKYVKVFIDVKAREQDYNVDEIFTFVSKEESYNSFPFFYFEMPDEDVTFTFSFDPQSVSVEFTGDALSDITWNPDYAWDPTGEYISAFAGHSYENEAYFVMYPASGKTTEDYIITGSDDNVSISDQGDHWDISFYDDASVNVDAVQPVISTHKLTINGQTGSSLNVCGYPVEDPDHCTWLSYTYDETTDTTSWDIIAGTAFQFDERYCVVNSFTPQLATSEDTLWGVGTSYEMADEDVEANISLRYDIGFTQDSDNGISNNIEFTPNQYPIAGATATISFKNSYTSSDITVTCADPDVTLVYDSQEDTYSFTMPAHNVEIKAVYTNPVVYTLQDDADIQVIPFGGDVAWEDGTTWKAGNGKPFIIIFNAGGTQADYTVTATSATITPDADPNTLSYVIEGTVNDTIVVANAQPPL